MFPYKKINFTKSILSGTVVLLALLFLNRPAPKFYKIQTIPPVQDLNPPLPSPMHIQRNEPLNPPIYQRSAKFSAQNTLTVNR